VDVLVVRPGPGERPAGVPVVVLVADGPVPAPGPPGGPVVLPLVPGWSGPGGGRAAAGLLRLSEQQTPAALRPAAAGLRAVAAALVGSGALERPCAAPPVPAGAADPRVRGPGPAPVPVRRLRAVPVLLHRATPVVPRLVAGVPPRRVVPDLVPDPPGRAVPAGRDGRSASPGAALRTG
jgi:hypothetical protein